MKKSFIFMASFLFIVTLLIAAACGQASITTKTVLSQSIVTETKTVSVNVAPVVVTDLSEVNRVSQEPIISISYIGFTPSTLNVNPGVLVTWYNTESTEIELLCDGIKSIFIPAYGCYTFFPEGLATYGFYLKGDPRVTCVLNVN